MNAEAGGRGAAAAGTSADTAVFEAASAGGSLVNMLCCPHSMSSSPF